MGGYDTSSSVNYVLSLSSNTHTQSAHLSCSIVFFSEIPFESCLLLSGSSTAFLR